MKTQQAVKSPKAAKLSPELQAIRAQVDSFCDATGRFDWVRGIKTGNRDASGIAYKDGQLGYNSMVSGSTKCATARFSKSKRSANTKAAYSAKRGLIMTALIAGCEVVASTVGNRQFTPPEQSGVFVWGFSRVAAIAPRVIVAASSWCVFPRRLC